MLKYKQLMRRLNGRFRLFSMAIDGTKQYYKPIDPREMAQLVIFFLKQMVQSTAVFFD